MAFCRSKGVALQHVKPHGAMYNMAGKDENLAMAVCRGIQEVDESLILLGLAGSRMMEAAKKIGLRFASEVFADRAYEEDGSLVARTKPGAMITDEELAVTRVVRMVTEGKVTSVTGKEIEITADSICVHGDGPKALAFVEKIRKALSEQQIEICSLKDICG